VLFAVQKERIEVEYRRLGRTDLKVSALALGTVELGLDYGIEVPGEFGRPTEAQAIRLVHSALDSGMNLIDTARAYGESEAVLGRALRGRRGAVVVATKVRTQRDDGTTPTGDALRQHMLESLETSLGLLQTEYVDIWQVHNVDAALLAQRELLAEVFADARSSGKARAIGGSTYGVEMPIAAIESDLFDMLQVTYSVLDQRLSDQLLPTAAERDIGIVVRSILLKCALTARGDYLPDHLAELRERSHQFRELVADSGLDISPVQVAVAFGLAHPHIHSVLVGVRSDPELREALGAASVELPADLLAQLAALRLDDADLLNPGTWGIP
jgi:aryl-alcohol dehydrogenase-like predicted oxidoreductase